MPPKKKATAPKDIVKGFSLSTPTKFSLGAAKPGMSGGPITAPMPNKKVKGSEIPLEKESNEELADLSAQFYDAKAKDKARRALHQAADYYVNIVFVNRADAQKFVDHVKLPVVAGRCLDGYAVCKALKIPMPDAYIAEPHVNVLDSWSDIALPITDPLHTVNAGSLMGSHEPEPPKPAKTAKPKPARKSK